MYNKIILLGRVVRDPELRFAAGSGTAVCKFTLAVNKRYNKNETNFINCVAFGKKAEVISQYVTKGNLFHIAGELNINSYERDGRKLYSAEVSVEEFSFCGSNRGNTNYGGSQGQNMQGNGQNFNGNNQNQNTYGEGNGYNDFQQNGGMNDGFNAGGNFGTTFTDDFGSFGQDMTPIDDGDIPF